MTLCCLFIVFFVTPHQSFVSILHLFLSLRFFLASSAIFSEDLHRTGLNFLLLMKEMIFLGRSGGGGGRSASKKKLYCVCRTPYDNSKFYVGCDLCSNWFHGSCVGITEVRHFLFFNGFTQLNWVLPCSLKGWSFHRLGFIEFFVSTKSYRFFCRTCRKQCPSLCAMAAGQPTRARRSNSTVSASNPTTNPSSTFVATAARYRITQIVSTGFIIET